MKKTVPCTLVEVGGKACDSVAAACVSVVADLARVINNAAAANRVTTTRCGRPSVLSRGAKVAMRIVSQASRWSKDLKCDLALVEPVGVVNASGVPIGSTLVPVVDGDDARVV